MVKRNTTCYEVEGVKVKGRLEADIARQIVSRGELHYEPISLKTERTTAVRYRPDFILPNGIVIETKGWLQASDRVKLVLFKERFPSLDLRLVFSNANKKITKVSRTSYGQWAARFRFPFAGHGAIPEVWFDEDPDEANIALLKEWGWTP